MDGNEIDKKYYRCCFCDQLIQSSHGSPCEIDILININKPKNQQYNQIFYCHMECFREQLHKDIKIHFVLECLIHEE
jgi:hypothetical protein